MNEIIERMGKIYQMIPLRIRPITNPFLFFIRFFIHYGYFRLDLWILREKSQNSEMPLSILCAAPVQNSTYFITEFLKLTHKGSLEEIYHERIWLWNISDVIKKNKLGCSIMVVEVPNAYRNLLNIGNYFSIPRRIFGEVRIPIDEEVMKADTLKSDLRKIKKYGLDFEVTRDPQSFEDFYHEMLIPYLTLRFGKTASISPYDHKFRKNKDRLLVKKEGKKIAGAIIAYGVYVKDEPTLSENGILDGNLEYLKEGALVATYHFPFIYLEKKGFKKVNLGGSLPLLNNGILKYKAKWSQRITGTRSKVTFALKILSETAATRAFLCNNPFIFQNAGLIYGAVFADLKRPFSLEELKQIDKNHFLPGLSKLFIYSFQPDHIIEEQMIPPELSDHLVLCSAKRIFLLMVLFFSHNILQYAQELSNILPFTS